MKFDLNKEIEKITNYQSLKYLMLTQQKVDIYNNIVVSVSGGSDSDIMIDMFSKLDKDKKVKYVWFDTGLEYQATKDHLKYLEEKYGVQIIREKAIKPIPNCCKEYGQPFLSKYVSEMITRLQKHNFKWENEDFEVLYKKYPNCKMALNWWCNNSGDKSNFNINRNKWLKEFIIENPPIFKISNQCCKYSKKNVAKNFNKKNKTELNCYGVRKSEGGIRSTAYKNCFTCNDDDYDEYRPLFFFTDEDKQWYKEHFNVAYSDCYEVWGMKRTGCVGCPYGRNLEEELALCEKYEPKLHKAVTNVFKDSYEYTKKYKKFRDEMKTKKNK